MTDEGANRWGLASACAPRGQVLSRDDAEALLAAVVPLSPHDHGRPYIQAWACDVCGIWTGQLFEVHGQQVCALDAKRLRKPPMENPT